MDVCVDHRVSIGSEIFFNKISLIKQISEITFISGTAETQWPENYAIRFSLHDKSNLMEVEISFYIWRKWSSALISVSNGIIRECPVETLEFSVSSGNIRVLCVRWER